MGTNSLSVSLFRCLVCGAHLPKFHILHKAYDALTYTPNSDADEKVTSKQYNGKYLRLHIRLLARVSQTVC